MTINVSRILNSGRYKLEKKRKQVQRAESEKIKDVVLGQIEAEKEPFPFLTLKVASAFGAAATFRDRKRLETHSWTNLSTHLLRIFEAGRKIAPKLGIYLRTVLRNDVWLKRFLKFHQQ